MTSNEKEKRIKILIDQDRKDDAVKLLFEMVVDCARARQFEKAESLRKQIMDVNSMALTEIINSAEIIETEKAKAIDQRHKNIWAQLYDGLNEEEINAFYFSLKRAKIKSGTMIMKQGRVNNRLFLIDSGVFNIIHGQGGSEVFLKRIMPGEPVGLQTFFSISLATTSTFSMDEAKFHYLERDSMKKLVEKFPGFDSKLENICSKLTHKKVENILKEKAVERRRHKRFRSAGKVSAYPLDSNGKPVNTPILGVLEDISEGGLGFSIRQSKQETARLLLGRRVLLHILPEKQTAKIPKNGIITSVYNQLFNNYMINFRFQKPMSHTQVMDLITTDSP